MDEDVHTVRMEHPLDGSSEKAFARVNDTPLISVIMANYRGGAHLAYAIESVLAQTLRQFELIIIDDKSPDDSVLIVDRYRDARIRLIALEDNVGPAAARNRGINAARGDWLAIVDNDDLIHPTRLSVLLKAAVTDGADIVADDLLIFDDGSSTISTMLPESGGSPFWVDPASFIRSNVIYGPRPSLGYCKPMIRRQALGAMRYDETLRIGEDSDLLLRMMIAGSRFRIYPELLYFYRKHSGSISHRFGEGDSYHLIAAETRLMRDHASLGAEVFAAHAERLHSLRRAAAFASLVGGLKARSPSRVLHAVRTCPDALWLLRLPLKASLLRQLHLIGRRTAPAVSRPGVMVLSRQRVAGGTNGSSAYLISIARFLRHRGYRVTYLSPSPTTFGRWPFLRIVTETQEAFDDFVVRGSVRVGRYMLVRDLRIWAWALLSLAEDRLLRFGILTHRRIPNAPYAVSQPLSRQDRLFLARRARKGSDAILLDYAFLAPARSYTLRPDARALIVMHDLFSSRVSRFDKIGALDSVALLDPDEEYALLAQADGIVAIQRAEAETVGARLPNQSVILAPMAVSVVAEAAPGDDGSLLFVGSNTAPNIIGITWFLTSVWPAILKRCPTTRLRLVGSVARGLVDLPAGVTCLGVVADLTPIYQSTAIVISPLTVGSGLKIKLIEAMGFGKAIVATSMTVEGVEALVEGAVVVVDEADAFATAVCELLGERQRRTVLAEAALAVARSAFAAEACYEHLPSALFPTPDAEAQVCAVRTRVWESIGR
ncbi:glycosyltransferase [Methylobacterium sp. BTF04]|uniref:glycosyltransferase n=1 Tax=Methylobacterium sp. BTF04 TaxID=2708300 RepID=UPI0013D08E56|nr:glycosyltransferase [Methylobacterium sp. BTF04]NEU14574.1 glycosyltransferase [Methylobacterium sp. BTF04]